MSSSSDDTRSTWASLLRSLQPEPTVPSESAFHDLFVELCVDVCERDPQRLLARFLRQHDQIVAFIGTLDESLELTEDDLCLGSCFWSLAYETVESALRRKKKRALFERYIPSLNETLPAFGSQLSEFPNDRRVQEPLQNAFRFYIECYLIMRNQFTSHSSPIAFEVFVDHATRVTEYFTQQKSEWEELVKEAREEAQADQYSQPSFPNGSLGPLAPFTTRATFDWMGPLGNGTYGQVSKVKESTTGTIYAQKIIRVSDPNLQNRVEAQVQNEVAIMQKLRHHHIASVQFYTREYAAFSLIMLPVADYDLLHYLHDCISTGFPTTSMVRLTSWFGCLVAALAFAHSKKIKHEDIKPRNILIKEYQPYLADFGCAHDFSELETSASTDILEFGTPVYWAPENRPRGRAADVFSLGCVFSEMLTVRQGRTLEEYQAFRYRRNRDNGYAFRENLDKVYDWVNSLVSSHDPTGDAIREETLSMLHADPSERADARHVKRRLPETVFCFTCC